MSNHEPTKNRTCRGRDRMVIGFMTICAISAYHHLSCELELRSDTTSCYKVSVTCNRPLQTGVNSYIFMNYFHIYWFMMLNNKCFPRLYLITYVCVNLHSSILNSPWVISQAILNVSIRLYNEYILWSLTNITWLYM